jgi:hypothetical protein
LVRRIRELLYEQGFTISGARNRLSELVHGRGGDAGKASAIPESELPDLPDELDAMASDEAASELAAEPIPLPEVLSSEVSLQQMREELISIRGLLVV